MNDKLTKLNLKLFNVDKKLQPFVQCYWQVKSILENSTNYHIAPDGAMGLIINLGDSIKIKTEKDNYTLKYGQILLLGIHEHSVSMVIQDNCYLLGIRFMAANINPRATKAPGASTIKVKGLKPG